MGMYLILALVALGAAFASWFHHRFFGTDFPRALAGTHLVVASGFLPAVIVSLAGWDFAGVAVGIGVGVYALWIATLIARSVVTAIEAESKDRKRAAQEAEREARARSIEVAGGWWD